MYSIQIIHVRKIHERYLQSTFNQSWKTWTSISWLFPYIVKKGTFSQKEERGEELQFCQKGLKKGHHDIFSPLHSPLGVWRPTTLPFLAVLGLYICLLSTSRGSTGSEGSRLSQIMTMMRSWWKRNCLLAWRRRRSLWCGLKASSNIVPGKLRRRKPC